MLEEIKLAQKNIFEKIKQIKRKYTKTNYERRTKEKVNFLISELNDLWNHFNTNEETVTANGEYTEYFSEVEVIVQEILEFLNCELIEICKSAVENPVNSNESYDSFDEELEYGSIIDETDNSANLITNQELEIETSKKAKVDNNIIDRKIEVENNLIMATRNIKDIVTCVNKCIPIFKGDESSILPAEISNFIACCDVVLSMFNSAEDQIFFFSIIKTRLQGRAYELVSQSQFQSSKELEKILKDYFIPKISHADIRLQLMQVKQFSNESIFDFGQRISGIFIKCKKSIEEKYSASQEVKDSILKEEEGIAVRCFRNGLLDDQIKLRLSCCELLDLKVAIEKAIKVDSEEKEVKTYSNYVVESTVKKPSINKKCNFCGKLGHQVQDCWHVPSTSSGFKPKQFSVDNQQQTQFPRNNLNSINSSSNGAVKNYQSNQLFKPNYNPNTYRNRQEFTPGKNKLDFVCYSCGKKGHTARSCRFKSVDQGQVRTVSNDTGFEFCQFCKVANHATINCQQFSNCLKSIMAQTGNGSGQSACTAAAVHKQ